MAAFGQYVFNTLATSFSSLSMSSTTVDEAARARHTPSAWDVLNVKNAIFQASGSLLPNELLDAIIDTAEYWPCVSVRTSSVFKAVGNPRGEHKSDTLVLRSIPIGYSPADVTDPKYVLPLDDKQINIEDERFNHAAPDASSQKDLSSDFYRHWAAKSQQRGKRICKKIVFSLKSHDQGWGGEAKDHNTYTGSYTWFDVGKEKFVAVSAKTGEIQQSGDGEKEHVSQPDVLRNQLGNSDGRDQPIQYFLRPVSPPLKTNGDSTHQELDHPFLPSDRTLQRNLTAIRETKEHVITWAYDDNIEADSSLSDYLDESGRGRATGNGQFIRDFEVGDVITVWARARFGGWVNTVEEVKMDIFWEV